MLVAVAACVSVGGNLSLREPPRFDGADYARLGRSLAEGRGYREGDSAGALPHTHFPPGYPLALAGLWRVVGVRVSAAHAASALATVGAVVLAWRWFSTMYAPATALAMGLAVAANWSWGRVGGTIQSEPLFLLLGQGAMLTAVGVGRRGGIGRGIGLGILLGGCVLTRHVGVCLAAALLTDLLLRKRFRPTIAAMVAAVVVVVPWAVWLLRAPRGTQVGLLTGGGGWDWERALFYVRRVPDALWGPFVESATVFGRSAGVAGLATAGASVVTAGVLVGWIGASRSVRRRLASLIGAVTMGLLLVWPFTEAGRFLIPLVPVLLVGGVEGLAWAFPRIGIRLSRRFLARAILAATIPYALYAVAAGRSGVQRRSHDSFDAACAWMGRPGALGGAVLTTHPSEVGWQTRRPTLVPAAEGGEEAIGEEIARGRVAYLLVDEERYARAPTNPLARYVAARPSSVRRVWASPPPRPISIYEPARKSD